LINASRELGIRVPEDLKVAGIDDFAMSPSEILPLTTYHIPYEGMGRRAFEMLTQVAGQSSSVVKETQLRGELVVREST
jgi:DNA-binding LacI/PurR family transcriptional regulator